MNYAIIGAGNVGQALAHAFARKNIDVVIATKRTPADLEPVAESVGPTVTATTLADALTADVVILAIPFSGVADIGKAGGNWAGRIVIDATNSYGVPLSDFDGLTASAVNAKSFPGAQFVKGFNHVEAEILAADPAVHGGRRVVFLSSDDEAAFKAASDLAETLGFAPVSLGTLAEGGVLTQARGKSWSPLNFQDLVKFD